MSDSSSRPLKSVHFAKPRPYLHLIPDELLIEVGKYLLPTTKLPLPSLQPHFENYRHPFDRRANYGDYISFRESCHKVSCLLKPIDKDFEIEIKSKEGLEKWFNAPKEKLNNVSRLRLNFTLDPTDDVATVSIRYWDIFISLLLKMPNLVELFFTSTPFCYHGKHGHTPLFELPNSDQSPLNSIISFGNEVKCRCCAEHLTRLSTCMPNLKHLKCTSQDSVSQINTEDDFEPYDFMINNDTENLETLYLKYWDLDTFGEKPMIELTSGSPKFKKLIYSSHAIESPYTLKQKGLVEAVQDDNDQWHFSVGREKGLDLNLSGLLVSDLSLFAEEWSQFNNMEEYDPGLVLNPVQYFTRTIYGKPPKRNSEPMFPYALQQVPPEVLEQIRIVGPEEYERVLKEAMIEATKIMKANWTSLKKVYWWQDRNKRPDSPTRDYLRWTAVITDGPRLNQAATVKT
ncbi:hypothetical protein I204_01358 [Kwoniella mangroviensis CBS 8886]|nr:hypothetical protein I204_01358 [Kwoniella mangroviensis CBS 8886]